MNPSSTDSPVAEGKVDEYQSSRGSIIITKIDQGEMVALVGSNAVVREMEDGRFSWSLPNGIGGIEDTFEDAYHMAIVMQG